MPTNPAQTDPSAGEDRLTKATLDEVRDAATGSPWDDQMDRERFNGWLKDRDAYNWAEGYTAFMAEYEAKLEAEVEKAVSKSKAAIWAEGADAGSQAQSRWDGWRYDPGFEPAPNPYLEAGE